MDDLVPTIYMKMNEILNNVLYVIIGSMVLYALYLMTPAIVNGMNEMTLKTKQTIDEQE